MFAPLVRLDILMISIKGPRNLYSVLIFRAVPLPRMAKTCRVDDFGRGGQLKDPPPDWARGEHLHIPGELIRLGPLQFWQDSSAPLAGPRPTGAISKLGNYSSANVLFNSPVV